MLSVWQIDLGVGDVDGRLAIDWATVHVRDKETEKAPWQYLGGNPCDLQSSLALIVDSSYREHGRQTTASEGHV